MQRPPTRSVEKAVEEEVDEVEMVVEAEVEDEDEYQMYKYKTSMVVKVEEEEVVEVEMTGEVEEDCGGGGEHGGNDGDGGHGGHGGDGGKTWGQDGVWKHGMWCSPVSIIDGDELWCWKLVKAIAQRLLKEEQDRKLRVTRGEEWQVVVRKGRRHGYRWKNDGMGKGGEDHEEYSPKLVKCLPEILKPARREVRTNQNYSWRPRRAQPANCF